MDEPARVDRLQGLGERGPERAQPLLAHGALGGEESGEGGSRDVGGGQPGGLRLGVGVDDLRGVESADLPGRGDLGAEAGAEGRVGGEFRPGDLDGDGAPTARSGEIDGAHAAFA